jgi:Fe2+ or Zn2+ uptake regulation protein
MNFEDELDDFEMPTPCAHCNKIFDLNDGTSFKNIIYCEKCGYMLNSMKELEDEIEDLSSTIKDAKITIKDTSIELDDKKKELSELKDKFLDCM